jgi:hypothetical protein
MARQTIVNSNGGLTGPAAGATMASVTVAAAQAAGWQAGTWFFWRILCYINGTTAQATDDDNVKILTNGAQLANKLSVASNATTGTPATISEFTGNAQWNGVNAPIQFETNAAGTSTAVYHGTVFATAIDTTDDLPTE